MSGDKIMAGLKEAVETSSKGEISDGYHTFNELYEHRHALFITLMNTHFELSWKSKLHDDGTMFEGGWFIAGMTLPTGTVTYHLPIRFWSRCDGVELVRSPPWDGHTPGDVVDRIMSFADLLLQHSKEKG